jgi:bifunctional DNase/RNase
MTMPFAAAMLLLATSISPPGADGRLVAAQRDERADLVPVELFTVGVDPRSATPIVLLREPTSGDVVPIWVGDAEARAIALALHGIDVPRPMTHDLMVNLLAELKATVEEVLVHGLDGSTYLGTVRLRLAGEDTLRDVDSRPSDALALALRTGARIRVARAILESSPEFDFIAPAGPEQVVQLLGVTVVSPTPAQRRQYAVGDRMGVLVTQVAGRAQEQGLRPGDLIVEANGRMLREPMDFLERVRATPAGAPVRLVVIRSGAEHEIELPLPDSPPAPDTADERFKV